ncbi:protein UBASH3A homolog isoform X2 [Bombyx mandarina]|uniref:Ecdysteroid-phosphate phosphatase n=1 Tax=Bombyx mandarina TaxID=7092 RepID=A0A6J2KGR8_BOMMA|nr:protein UBASH3A homolog isoform X2 [Bombyx mandarina]
MPVLITTNIIRNILCKCLFLGKMANLPPRKVTSASKSKQDASPLQILLQMGFRRQRALKALAATGNRSVQLASDWLLTHVSDSNIDADDPREYIFYASPTGPLLSQLLEFWDKSKSTCGWNGAHNFLPHITLVSFFKAPDDTSLHLAKAVRQVVENVGDPPKYTLKLEPYVSHNFMGLFISEEHAEYLKKIAVQYVKQVSSVSSINLEAHVKSLHITLAYHFEESSYEDLKSLVEEMQPVEHSSWELRLYSRDPRFANHQVYKVTQGYSPQASDELELVLGDYIYIEEKEFDISPDGWVHGTSWLTGLNGYLPAVYTRRTAETDAWTLHKAVSLGNNCSDCKSESGSNTDSEMAATYPHEDAADLAYKKSEETYQEWDKYWSEVMNSRSDSILTITQGLPMNWELSKAAEEMKNNITNGTSKSRRWVFALRHGERVDLTYGPWVPHCFENDTYVRKDLNLPLKLAHRAGGKGGYVKDTPLTRLGWFQAQLVGEGMRMAGVSIKHVYASPALRCVETAQGFLDGLRADPSVKIKVEPGLFEFKNWHMPKGIDFMTPIELCKAGLNVDMTYKPYVEMDASAETMDEFFKRGEVAMQAAVNDTEKDGGNVIFIGHAITLDQMVGALHRLRDDMEDVQPYEIGRNLLKVPYCALGAMRGKPWDVVSPPCPPSINSSSGRFDWRILIK